MTKPDDWIQRPLIRDCFPNIIYKNSRGLNRWQRLCHYISYVTTKLVSQASTNAEIENMCRKKIDNDWHNHFKEHTHKGPHLPTCALKANPLCHQQLPCLHAIVLFSAHLWACASCSFLQQQQPAKLPSGKNKPNTYLLVISLSYLILQPCPSLLMPSS